MFHYHLTATQRRLLSQNNKKENQQVLEQVGEFFRQHRGSVITFPKPKTHVIFLVSGGIDSGR